MFLEALLTRVDLELLLSEALPLTIHLGDPAANHSIVLSDLGAVTLVPDVGLRVHCKVRVHWPVVGIEVPIVVPSLGVLMKPTIKPGPHGDVLAFDLSVEDVDVTGVPSMLDGTITGTINAKLAEHPLDLAWDFSDLLGHILRLPAMLEPLDAFAIRASWGKVRVTSDAFVLAVSLHTALLRHEDSAPSEFEPLMAATPPRLSLPKSEPPPAIPAGPLFAASVFGLAAGAAYFGLRAALGARW
jgi:hypothetical protein